MPVVQLELALGPLLPHLHLQSLGRLCAVSTDCQRLIAPSLRRLRALQQAYRARRQDGTEAAAVLALPLPDSDLALEVLLRDGAQDQLLVGAAARGALNLVQLLVEADCATDLVRALAEAHHGGHGAVVDYLSSRLVWDRAQPNYDWVPVWIARLHFPLPAVLPPAPQHCSACAAPLTNAAWNALAYKDYLLYRCTAHHGGPLCVECQNACADCSTVPPLLPQPHCQPRCHLCHSSVEYYFDTGVPTGPFKLPTAYTLYGHAVCAACRELGRIHCSNCFEATWERLEQQYGECDGDAECHLCGRNNFVE